MNIQESSQGGDGCWSPGEGEPDEGINQPSDLQAAPCPHLGFEGHELEDHLQGEEDGEGHVEDV